MADPTTRTDDSDPDVRDQPGRSEPPHRTRRRFDPLTVVTTLSIAAYAIIGIGSPLLGLKVFAATDLLTQVSPYRDTGLGDTVVQNTYLNDTIDAYLPNIALFVSALYSGQLGAWNPYIIGGTPLGATLNLGLINPIALPYFLLPIWLAPGYVKLLEICFAAGGTFLFLRRVGLGRPAALLGGLVFASSGFMVAWTNWPHTRVAAFIPWLFWALERLVIRRRVADGVLVAAVTAVLIFSGFPAVAGYALLFGGCYLVVRTFAEYPGQWRRILGVGFGSAAAVVAGVAATAVQLLPFLSFMSAAHVEGREQSPDDHLLPESLVTALAPWAMGSTDPERPPFWYLPVNLVESLMYVGAGALVLVVVALAMPRAGRSLTPRGVWWYLVGATASLAVVLYVGRLPLLVLQQLPVLFSENFVGRARSVLGFLIAALAAIGFQLVLEHRRAGGPRWYALGVWLAAGLAGAVVWWDARRAAYQASARHGVDPAIRVDHLNREMVIGVGFVVLAMALVAALWWAGAAVARRPRARLVRGVAAALLPILVAGQALTLAVPYWPRVERETFYPVTDTHRWLAEHLGHERFTGSGGAMYVGADSAARLRALTGHFFLNGRFAETIDGLPGRQFGNPPTFVNMPPDPKIATHPVLDRLGVKYFVASPGAPVFGDTTEPATDGSTVTLRPSQPVTVSVPGTGPLRAIGLIPAAPFETNSKTRVELRLRDASGDLVASSERLLYNLAVDQPFWIPIPAEEVPKDATLTAELVLRAGQPLAVRGAEGGPAVGTVRPTDDGLRVAYVGSTVIYERLTAAPRIRWASEVRVEPDPRRRVALVASGDLAADEVVLDAQAAPAEGAPATVRVIHDGLDEIRVSVRAEGAGYLVVADALQQDWVATVDGKPAELVPADHGLVAVHVPAGAHQIRLSYQSAYGNLGVVITGITVFTLFVLFVTDWWWHRRTGRTRLSSRTPRG